MVVGVVAYFAAHIKGLFCYLRVLIKVVAHHKEGGNGIILLKGIQYFKGGGIARAVIKGEGNQVIVHAVF